jgi:hypothetical protein
LKYGALRPVFFAGSRFTAIRFGIGWDMVTLDGSGKFEPNHRL